MEHAAAFSLLSSVLLFVRGDVVYDIPYNTYMQINNSDNRLLNETFTICVSFCPTQLKDFEGDEHGFLYLPPLRIGVGFALLNFTPSFMPEIAVNEMSSKLHLPQVATIRKNQWNSLCLAGDINSGRMGESS